MRTSRSLEVAVEKWNWIAGGEIRADRRPLLLQPPSSSTNLISSSLLRAGMAELADAADSKADSSCLVSISK